uniref:histone acetyltransferase n=1 Tax=Drosophila rhopaloa TaxID=1041015 RepID=A0A6P4FM40_DRORH
MEKLGFDIDDGSAPTDHKQADPEEARKQSIQRCIQSLVHACQCRDANCRRPSCHKMKRVVQHTKNCRRKTDGGCPICKQLIALCCYHAKHYSNSSSCCAAVWRSCPGQQLRLLCQVRPWSLGDSTAAWEWAWEHRQWQALLAECAHLPKQEDRVVVQLVAD